VPGPASSDSILDGNGAATTLPATGGRWLWIGLGVVTLVAAAHAAHDISDGDGVPGSLASSVLIVAQCVVLAAGYACVSRRKLPRWVSPAGGVLISVGFGVFVVALHDEMSSAMARHVVAGGAVGLGIACLWLFLFRLPVALERESGEAELLVGGGLGDGRPGVRVPVARERAHGVRELLLAGATGIRRP